MARRMPPPGGDDDDTKKPRRRMYVSSDTAATYNDPQAMALAKNLNALMLRKGWSQMDLVRAAQPHVPPGKKFERHLVSSWMTGKHMPSRLNVEIAAAALGVSVAELIPEGAATIVGQPEKAMQVSVTAAGMARVKLDMELPAEVAIEIMALAQKASGSAH